MKLKPPRLAALAVKVETLGAELTIRWTGTENDLNCSVWMTGPALAVFEGEMETDGR